jgi:hypothetical protein
MGDDRETYHLSPHRALGAAPRLPARFLWQLLRGGYLLTGYVFERGTDVRFSKYHCASRVPATQPRRTASTLLRWDLVRCDAVLLSFGDSVRAPPGEGSSTCHSEPYVFSTAP